MRRYKASFRAEPASRIAASAVRASFSVKLSRNSDNRKFQAMHSNRRHTVDPGARGRHRRTDPETGHSQAG